MLQLIVIASIHQPSTKTFNVFDSVYLLGQGRLAYGGPLLEIIPHFAAIGLQMPFAVNPAEWILELVDIDFARDRGEAQVRLKMITDACAAKRALSGPNDPPLRITGLDTSKSTTKVKMMTPLTLLHRNLIKSYRDVIPYWIRVLMYTCES